MKHKFFHVPRPALFTFFSVAMLTTCLIFFMFSSDHSYGLSPGNELFINQTENVKVAGNIYEKPTANSLAIARAQKGETVTLLVLQGEWYVVRLSSDRLGWAHRNLFSEISAAPAEHEKTPAVPDKKASDEKMPIVPDKKASDEKTPVIPDMKASLEEMPIVPDKKASGEETASIPDKKASDIPVIPSEPEKTAAVPDKKEVSVPVSSETPESKTPEKKIMLKVSAGRVREIPSVQSAVKFVLEKGDIVSLVRTEEDWYLVRLDDGTAGWAHSSLFSEPVHILKAIRFDLSPEGEEKIVFVLNGYYPPTTFVLEEEKVNPKVICDFVGAQLGAETGRRIEVNGKMIQSIRIGVHEDAPSPKIRVVIDLVSDRIYEVGQKFFEKENFYILDFKPTSQASGQSR
ncbi:MAG: hypothetical protein BWK80_18970 [Desulfobacteraceae bacterium IS3]|nr:MAG: hypothetical protein BWK80_18970 [Desulfobacteraceae bacterium IS3]